MKLKFIDYICKLTSVPRFTGSYLVQPQSGADHAYRVAMLALQMVDDYNHRNPSTPISREEVLMKALIHDVEESVIGDLPSPVKYITPEFREAVRVVEENVMENVVLADAGPQSKEYYQLWLNAKKDESGKIVKIADKLEGFIKINFEIKQGNAGLTDAYTETIEWFEDHQDLLAPFQAAQDLVNYYRIASLDKPKK